MFWKKDTTVEDHIRGSKKRFGVGFIFLTFASFCIIGFFAIQFLQTNVIVVTPLEKYAPSSLETFISVFLGLLFGVLWIEYLIRYWNKVQGEKEKIVTVAHQQAKTQNMEFLSIAVHKIRTPLTGIKWFLELLLAESMSPTAHEYVRQISVSNERMTQLADDLLDV